MDLNLLKIFDAVARARSFSAAARELRLPKSSVSRAVARLEAEVGAQLLFRTTRHVAPSAAGLALHDRLAPLLEELQSAIGEVPESEEILSGTLRVTAPVDLGVLFLAEVVTRYAARFPAVSVELSLTSRVVELVREGFDLALRVAPALRDSSLRARKAAPLTLQLFASPNYLARRGVPRSEADLAAHAWVAFGLSEDVVRLEGPRGAVELAPAARIRCDDLLFVRDALRAGAGIGLLPSFVAAPEVAAGALVRVLPRLEQPAGHVYVVMPAARRVSRKVSTFSDLVIEMLAAGSLAP